jgi:hypothetical protein
LQLPGPQTLPCSSLPAPPLRPEEDLLSPEEFPALVPAMPAAPIRAAEAAPSPATPAVWPELARATPEAATTIMGGGEGQADGKEGGKFMEMERSLTEVSPPPHIPPPFPPLRLALRACCAAAGPGGRGEGWGIRGAGAAPDGGAHAKSPSRLDRHGYRDRQ